METVPISKFDLNNVFNNVNLERIHTPAFVYNEGLIQHSVTQLSNIAKELGIKILFSLKSFAMIEALRLMSPLLNGFASSSLFEATLAREIISNNGTVHLTSPSFKSNEIDKLVEICDYVSFNSLPQLSRFRKLVGNRAKCGLRVNPQLSFVKDERYNPCRKYSKLGVPLDFLLNTLNDSNGELQQKISGIHFHTNCESTSLKPLLLTVQHLDHRLNGLFKSLEWLNLGGGYQYDEINSLEPLFQAVDLLRRKYNLEIFIEPGEAIVGNAGYIVSSVVDLFESEGKTVAILDTSINHIPQVYEYQYRPDILNSNLWNRFSYILGGASCLAGDIFGEYNFDAPLEIGSKVVFEFMGAYTMVKAHMFNGINLPTIYALNSENKLILKKQFTYQDYISRWKDTSYEAL